MLNFNILRAGALLVLILALSTSTARPFEGRQDESGTTSRRRAYVTDLYTLMHHLRTALGFSEFSAPSSHFLQTTALQEPHVTLLHAVTQ